MPPSQPQKSSSGLTHWGAGSQLRSYTKKIWSSRPTKYTCKDAPASEKLIALRSTQVPRRKADIKPSETPSKPQRITPPITMLAVIGSPAATMLLTVELVRNE